MSEEDKQWFSDQLRKELLASEARVNDQIQEVLSSEARLNDQIKKEVLSSEARLNDQIKKEVVASEARLAEKIFDSETKLLTKFQKWASPVEMRVRSHRAALRAMDQELEGISDRVSKLEGKS